MSLDPERIRAAVTIYKHRRSGAFRIQPMCRRGRFGLADTGEATAVPPGDDDALVLSTERALDSYLSNTFGPESRGLSPKEQAQFIREYDSVMVVRLDDGLEITPWERTRGGFASTDNASITLRQPFTAATLAGAIREAFKQTR